MIAPSVGGHHDQPFAIFEVDKGAGTRFTAFSPCGRQEQVPASDDPRTDESSRVTVNELMEPEVGKLQRSRGGVAHESHSFCRCRRLPLRRPRRRAIGAPRPVRMSAHSSEPASRLGGPGDGASSASDRVALQGGPVNGRSWLSGVDAVRRDPGQAGAPAGGIGGTPRGRSPASDAPPCGS